MEALSAVFVGSAPVATAGGTALAVGGAGLTPAAAAAAAGASAGTLTLTPATVGLVGAGGAFGGGILQNALSGLDFGIGDAFTGFGALAAIAAGEMQADALRAQGESQRVQARADRLEGALDALRIAEDLNEKLGSNIARKAASGIRGSGSIAAAQEAAVDKAQFEIDVARDAAEIRAISREQQGEVFGLEADGAEASGIATAVRGVGTHIQRRVARG